MCLNETYSNFIDKMEQADDVWQCFLNTKTGELVDIQIEYMGVAEELGEDYDLSEYADWEQETIQQAITVLENWEDYVRLPTQFDIHEYHIMEMFTYSLADERKSNRLELALRGKRAFRRFKDCLIDMDIEEDLYGVKR